MVGMWLGSLGRIVCYVCGSSINELWWVVMGYWGPEESVYSLGMEKGCPLRSVHAPIDSSVV